MDLYHIVSRIAEGIPALDAADTCVRYNRRTKAPYLCGVKVMSEVELTRKLCAWWVDAHPEDFADGSEVVPEIDYPKDSKAHCDLVIRDSATKKPLWAIEVKHIALVGDNGKNNDYGVAKMLSPYLKDRSLRHDVIRLKSSGFGCKMAAVVYAFSYSPVTVAEARSKHPSQTERIDELDRVRRSACDHNGVYSIIPMVKLVSYMLKSDSLASDEVHCEFKSAFSHPCGGDGIVVGWELT